MVHDDPMKDASPTESSAKKAEAGGVDAGKESPEARAARGFHLSLVELFAERPILKVWRARDKNKRELMLVVLRDEAADADRARFASATKKLHSLPAGTHGVARVLAVTRSGWAYVTEGWPTGTVSDLPGLAWPPSRRLEFLRRAALALDALHRAGVVHGCICAENMVVDDNLDPVFTEAGSVSVHSLTENVAEVTPYLAFAAPEVVDGAEPNVRSDIFSLGRLVQHVLGSDEVPEIAYAVQKCLAPVALSRYVAAAELASAISAAAEGQASREAAAAATAAPRPRPPPQTTKHEKAAERSSLGRISLDRASAAGPPPRWLMPAAVGVVVATLALTFAGVGVDGGSRIGVELVLFSAAAGAVWAVPALSRVRTVLHVTVAIMCGILVAWAAPLDLAARLSLTRALRGSPESRLAALDELNRTGRNFHDMALSGVNLSGLDLRGADMRGADLSGANLSHTNLGMSAFSGTFLMGTDLSGSDLQMVMDLNQAHDIESARCDESTIFPPPWRCTAGSPRGE
jgi:serine/threonine protein kinase